MGKDTFEAFKCERINRKNTHGTGCMSTSLIDSFLPCSENKLESAIMGTLAMSLSRELVDLNNLPIGTFKVNLFDNMFTLNKEILNKYAKIEVL